MLNISEIKKLDGAAISLKVIELRKELFDFRIQKHTTGVEKSHLLRQAKRDIARLLTVSNLKKESK